MYHEIEEIFKKRLGGAALTAEEDLKYQTAFMLFEGAEIARRGWVMQLHFGCKRDNNTPMFDRLGPDTGYRCVLPHGRAGVFPQRAAQRRKSSEDDPLQSQSQRSADHQYDLKLLQ